MKKLFFALMMTIMSTMTLNAQNDLQDRLELKKLVDTFSNLADVKDVDSQVLLFTPDATVRSKGTGFVRTGRDQIGSAFANYLALFDIVYHLNGQQTVEIDGDTAKGTAYCFVTLIGNGQMQQSGVRYQDTYVKVEGKWYIKDRESDFMFTDFRPLGQPQMPQMNNQ